MGLTKSSASSKGRNTKDVILHTATRIASTHGLAGLSIGELAKAVGMSKSGLFAHFNGKDQLQLQVLHHARNEFVDVVMRPAFKKPRGVARIEALFENWITHLDDQEALPGGNVLITASIELDDQPGPLRDFIQQVQRDLILNIQKAAQFAVKEGEFRQDLDVGLFAWTLYSFVLGYHHFRRMLEDPQAETHLNQSFKNLVRLARA